MKDFHKEMIRNYKGNLSFIMPCKLVKTTTAEKNKLHPLVPGKNDVLQTAVCPKKLMFADQKHTS